MCIQAGAWEQEKHLYIKGEKMKIYITSFKITTYYLLTISLFFGFISLVNQKFVGLAIFTFIFIVWFNAYSFLKKQTKKAFIASYFVVNFFFVPLLYRTYERLRFISENGGFERADGAGSPLAFLMGLFFEQMFFIPITILFILGLFVILFWNKGEIK